MVGYGLNDLQSFEATSYPLGNVAHIELGIEDLPCVKPLPKKRLEICQWKIGLWKDVCFPSDDGDFFVSISDSQEGSVKHEDHGSVSDLVYHTPQLDQPKCTNASITISKNPKSCVKTSKQTSLDDLFSGASC